MRIDRALDFDTAVRLPGRTATLRRQLVLGYLAPLVASVLLVIVATTALLSVRNSKDQVIERESVLVAQAYRLEAAINAKSVEIRNYLLAGDPSHLDEIEAIDSRIADAQGQLAELSYTEEGRADVADLHHRIDRWGAVVADVLGEFGAGSLTGTDVGRALEDRILPALDGVRELVEDITDRENAHIDEARTRSGDAARNALVTLWVLAAVAVIASLAVAWLVARRVNRRITAVALTIDSSGAEILASTSQQVAGAAEQAAAVQQTTSTVEELVETAHQSAERARMVADQAQDAADVAEAGTAAVAASIEATNHIREQVQGIADTVVDVGGRAQAISGIVATVNDIADQIHLLALNAAIEAARAGENGRGFAVVAAEVRELAQQSRRATAEVSTILGEIREGANRAVLATEAGAKSVHDGAARVEDAGQTIARLAEAASTAAIAAEQIAASSSQQAAATAQISHAMRSVDEVTEQNLAAARQSEEAARDLNRVAAELKAFVGV